VELQVASYFGWPVSTTHCIIGAMVGFGLIYGGVGAVYWKSLARVIASWVVSPVLGAVVAFVVYKCIRTVCMYLFQNMLHCLLNNCQFSSVDIGLFICRLVEVAAA
jgi:phosphate/sulfate permease